jgi:uncharacterized DUF497 family protein
MEFEWDENKNRANQATRSLSFEAAATAFYDPHHILGGCHPLHRYWLIGRVPVGDLLFVVYTWRQYEDQTRSRIISARKASRKERSRYQALHAIEEG